MFNSGVTNHNTLQKNQRSMCCLTIGLAPQRDVSSMGLRVTRVAIADQSVVNRRQPTQQQHQRQQQPAANSNHQRQQRHQKQRRQ
jgi:hypothetical protein